MKKTLLSILLLLFINTLFSQETSYDPLIKPGSFWDSRTYGNQFSIMCSNLVGHRRYAIDKDTLINNRVYNKIKIYDAKSSYPEGVSFVIEEDRHRCWEEGLYFSENDFHYSKDFISEDISERKVYIWTPVDLLGEEVYHEYLLFDFSLTSEQNVMENSYFAGGRDVELEISIVDNKKHFKWEGFEYAEGIGDLSEGLIPDLSCRYLLGVTSYCPVLFCYGNDNESSDCDEVPFLGIEKHNLENVRVYPNPVKDQLFVESNESITIKLLAMHGGTVAIYKSEGDLEINTSTLEKGIYILEIINSRGFKDVSKLIVE